jgi:anti-sigma-K factor RskA
VKLSLDAAQQLAAAYALGTLRGPARRRFERMYREDETLGRLVHRWEFEFATLATDVPAVEPPARVWRDIEQRINRPQANSFWRAFGLVAGGLATILLAFVVWISTGPRGEPLFVAVLTAQDSGPRAVVSMHEPDLISVKLVKPWSGTEGKDLELWVLPTEGAPRSLGLIANSSRETLIRIRSSDARMQGATALAVSLEPAGGSPTRAPTGPVLCSGAIAPVRKT